MVDCWILNSNYFGAEVNIFLDSFNYPRIDAINGGRSWRLGSSGLNEVAQFVENSLKFENIVIKLLEIIMNNLYQLIKSIKQTE